MAVRITIHMINAPARRRARKRKDTGASYVCQVRGRVQEVRDILRLALLGMEFTLARQRRRHCAMVMGEESSEEN
jgi:hypothetical protein